MKMSEEKNPLIRIGALWRSQSGKVLTGKLGEARLVILPNRHKEAGDKRPDYVVFVTAPDQPARESSGDSSGGFADDDIPF